MTRAFLHAGQVGWGSYPGNGGYLGNVPSPPLATLHADVSHGYVRVFVQPLSPPGPDPRVRWIESHYTRQAQSPHRRLRPYAGLTVPAITSAP